LVAVDHVAGGDGEGAFGGAGGKRLKVEDCGLDVFSRSSRGIGQGALFLHHLNDFRDVLISNGMRQNLFGDPLIFLGGTSLEKME